MHKVTVSCSNHFHTELFRIVLNTHTHTHTHTHTPVAFHGSANLVNSTIG